MDQTTSAQVLVHYDPTLPIIIAADASQLMELHVEPLFSHIFPERSKKLTVFPPHTPTQNEKNYAELERNHCL